MGRRIPASDKKIPPPGHSVNTIALDATTARRVDENGFLHVSACHISKETINPYYGREIPGWQEAGPAE